MKTRRAFGLLAALALVGGHRTAWGEPMDDATRSAARRLGEEAVALAETGEHAAAVEKFERALSLMQVPTLALLTGKSLEKLGRWVEAAEHYRRATGMQIDPTLSAAFQEAQKNAQTEAAAAERALRPRLAGLVVVVRGAPPEKLELELDSKPLPKTLVGIEVPIDPGEHVLALRRGSKSEERRFTLGEGQKQTESFEFPDVRPPPPPPPPRKTPARLDAPPKPASSRSAWPTIGWVALGAGGVGLGVGGYFWASARAKADTLEGKCEGSSCPAEQRSRVDAYDRDKLVSNVGWALGGLLVGTGTGILLFAPRSDRASSALVVAPGSVAFRRAF